MTMSALWMACSETWSLDPYEAIRNQPLGHRCPDFKAAGHGLYAAGPYMGNGLVRALVNCGGASGVPDLRLSNRGGLLSHK